MQKKFDKPIVELFDLNSTNIDKLKDEVYNTYHGKELTTHDLFEKHHTNNLYSRSHYTSALRRLVDEGKLNATFTDNKDHKKSVLISKECILKFN